MEQNEFTYQGNVIEFFFKDDLMVNATEMAKVFGKKVYGFTRSESFKTMVEGLENTMIRANRSAESTLRSAGNRVLEGEIKHRSADLVPLVIVQKGGDEGGVTWMHRYLAIDFAMWLDVDFKIWILGIIDKLLVNYSTEKRTLALRKRTVNQQINSLISTSKNEEVKTLAKLLKEKDQIKGEEFNLNKNFNKGLFD